MRKLYPLLRFLVYRVHVDTIDPFVVTPHTKRPVITRIPQGGISFYWFIFVARGAKDVVPVRIDGLGHGSQKQEFFPEVSLVVVLVGMGTMAGHAGEAPIDERDILPDKLEVYVRIAEWVEFQKVSPLKDSVAEIAFTDKVGIQVF
jgi:hypothetical protein